MWPSCSQLGQVSSLLVRRQHCLWGRRNRDRSLSANKLTRLWRPPGVWWSVLDYGLNPAHQIRHSFLKLSHVNITILITHFLIEFSDCRRFWNQVASHMWNSEIFSATKKVTTTVSLSSDFIKVAGVSDGCFQCNQLSVLCQTTQLPLNIKHNWYESLQLFLHVPCR